MLQLKYADEKEGKAQAQENRNDTHGQGLREIVHTTYSMYSSTVGLTNRLWGCRKVSCCAKISGFLQEGERQAGKSAVLYERTVQYVLYICIYLCAHVCTVHTCTVLYWATRPCAVSVEECSLSKGTVPYCI
jgi:hypothetical protein